MDTVMEMVNDVSVENDNDFLGEIRSIEKAIESGEITTLQQVQQRISKFLDGLYPEVGFFQEVVDKLFIDGVVEISIEFPDGLPCCVSVAYSENTPDFRKKLMGITAEIFQESEHYIDFEYHII